MSNKSFAGKLLPNLRVTVENKSDFEEQGGQITDSENAPYHNKVSKDEIVRRQRMQTLQAPTLFNHGGFETGLDLSSPALIKKLEERAIRFGLNEKDRSQITQVDINALYQSLGLDPEILKNSANNVRLKVIHMRGVYDMSTKQVLEYFKDYGPSKVEWINDVSCNVCWNEETSAARALLGVSQPFVIKEKNKNQGESKEIFDFDVLKVTAETKAVVEISDFEDEEVSHFPQSDSEKPRSLYVEEDKESSKENPKTTDAEDGDSHVKDINMEITEQNNKSDSENISKNASLDVPVPSGYWRVGVPHIRARAILLRFATKDDKKLPEPEKRSQLFPKYGNPNYGGDKKLPGAEKRSQFFSKYGNPNYRAIYINPNYRAIYGNPNYRAKYGKPNYRDDKKLPGAEKRNQIFSKYGNPNYGGVKGVISTSKKRQFQTMSNRQVVEKLTGDCVSTSRSDTHCTSGSVKRSKQPFMKMYADKEEKTKTKDYVQEHSEKPRNIKKRLAVRYTSQDLRQLGHSFSGGEEDHYDQEELSVLCKIPNKFNICKDQAMAMSKQETYGSEIAAHQSRKRYRDQSSEEDTSDGHTSLESGDYRYGKHYRYRKNSDDLRNYLASSSQKSAAPKADLRSKIQQLKNEDKPRKHRSPLCVSDSD